MEMCSNQEIDGVPAELGRADLTIHISLNIAIEWSIDAGDRNFRAGVVVADRANHVDFINTVNLVVRDDRVGVGIGTIHLGADRKDRVTLTDELVARDDEGIFDVREGVAGSGIALRFDVRREAAVPDPARFAEALSGVPHDIVGNLEIVDITAVPRRALGNEILDGIVAVFDDVIVVINVQLICRVAGIGFVLAVELLGNARVIHLIDIVVLHAEVVAAAVDLHGVAVSRLIARSAHHTLNRSADPPEFAVLNENVLQIQPLPADAVSAELDANVIHAHIIGFVNFDPILFDRELDGREAETRIFLTAKIEQSRSAGADVMEKGKVVRQILISV